MQVAYLQYNPAYLERTRNLKRVEALLEGVEADLIVLPELFASGYFFKSIADLEAIAEPVPDGPTTQWMFAWSRKTGAVLVGGLPERSGTQLFNSAVVVGPDGLIGRYRKIHLFYEEKLHFSPGDLGFPVFDVADRSGQTYRLGVMICYDWYFPEAARTLALQGADVIAHPANLVRPDCPRAMPIRALENHVFTITANRYGMESNGRETLRFIGRSLICDPAGRVLQEAPAEGDQVGLATIDPREARTRRITPHNDLFADRRPAFYRLS
ncbi:nitrilase-related carbon-nitrogen hydrolase [Rhodothermus profundi]|uniref:Predicted amidohydrolase n=1 Tax=Rhodothermus profundi TaxID=633813 RepID=A0A1M6SNH8_9BACT|nr:nitrilase-related carbon-nitrogen hydrolase [Rhodothermus profundi]SHK46294.1 Predicted amidohydrolase [Rhodothermus profundi]